MDTDSLTRERAYRLWQQAGCPEGRSEEFRFAAADGIAAETVLPAAAAPPRPAPSAKKAAARRRNGTTAGGAVPKGLTRINTATPAATILPS